MSCRYIVTFDNSIVKESRIDIIKKYDGKIRYLFELIPAAAIELEQEKVELLKNEEQIENVFVDIQSIESKPKPFKFLEPDGRIKYLVPKDYDFELDRWQREHQKNADPSPGMAIIDTGVDKQHPILRGRVKKEYDFTGEGPADLNGHGTIVAMIGVMSALNPNIIKLGWGLDIGIINVKVANRRGVFWESDVMAGIELLAKQAIVINQPIVVNISLGVYNKDCVGNCPLCSMAKAARSKAGLFIVAAAGNIPGLTSCPAKSEGSHAVGALDSSGKIARYSGTAETYYPGDVEFKKVYG